MAAAFRLDEKVTIERKAVAHDPEYGTEIEAWVPVASNIWANVQDVLLVRSAESTNNGLRIGAQRTRLRIRNNAAVAATMRITLHNKGNRLMQIIGGPAMLDDRVHTEFLLEGYSS